MKATLYENQYVDGIRLERFKAYAIVGITVSALAYIYVYGTADGDNEEDEGDNGYDDETYVEMSFDLIPGAVVPTSLLEQLGVTLEHEDVNLLNLVESILDPEMEGRYGINDIESNFDIEKVTIIANGEKVTLSAHNAKISNYAMPMEHAIYE